MIKLAKETESHRHFVLCEKDFRLEGGTVWHKSCVAVTAQVTKQHAEQHDLILIRSGTMTENTKAPSCQEIRWTLWTEPPRRGEGTHNSSHLQHVSGKSQRDCTGHHEGKTSLVIKTKPNKTKQTNQQSPRLQVQSWLWVRNSKPGWDSNNHLSLW